jgi:hypothetical protein
MDISRNPDKTEYIGPSKGGIMGLRNLAEAIILQSLEDIWSEKHRKESVDFICGERFRLCAQIAGMGTAEQIDLLLMLHKSLSAGSCSCDVFPGGVKIHDKQTRSGSGRHKYSEPEEGHCH